MRTSPSSDDLSKSETVTVAAIEGGVPLLVEAREAIAAFQTMIRKKSIADLDPWFMVGEVFRLRQRPLGGLNTNSPRGETLRAD
jgi:hypothetical protein